jgi:hypothetical protein
MLPSVVVRRWEGHHIEEAVVDRLQAEVAVDTLLFHNGF